MVSGLRDCVLATFLSFPEEASLTALFRGLEVCACRDVLILSTKRREGQARRFAEELNEVLGGLGIRVEALPSIPDVDSSPEDVPGVVTWFRRDFLRGRVKGSPLCLMVSAGSRLEVSVAAISLERGLSNVAYVAFLWGPWRGTHYPYTPKPVEPLAGIHCRHGPTCDELGGGGAELSTRVIEAALKVVPPPEAPRLRRATLEAQARLNAELPVARNPCVVTPEVGGRGCPGGCGPLSIEVAVSGGRVRLRAEASDYCSWDDVVDAVVDLAKQYVEAMDKGVLGEREDSIVSTILDLTGVRQLRVADVSGSLKGGLSSFVGHALMEALHALPKGWVGVLDTNVLYKGIHVQALDYGVGNPPKVALPACAVIELYEHVAQVRHERDVKLGRFRAEVAALVADLAKHLTPIMIREADAKPCEVGIALTASTRTGLIPVTADRAACENLLSREEGIPASILAELAPINEVAFSERVASRRVTYAYYAVAQLKALSSILGSALRHLGAGIKVRVG